MVFSPLSSSSKKRSNKVMIHREKKRTRYRRVISLPIIIFPYHRLRKTLTNLTQSKFKIWATYLDSESSNNSRSNFISSNKSSHRVSNFKNKSRSHPKESHFHFQDLILPRIISRFLND